MSPSVQHPALAHGRPGGLATTADRPGQEGLPAGHWPLAAGSLCRTFAFSSPGRKEPPSPPAIGITTQHAPSAGRELTRVPNLFRCSRSHTYPEATLALQLLLQLTPQLRACGLLCRATARPRLQELAPILDLRQALSHPGDQRRIEGEGPGLAIARVAGAELQDHSGPRVPRVLHSTVVTVGGFPVKTSCSITATRRS